MTFFKTLWQLLDYQLHVSATFLPQANGQDEVVYHSLVHALCIYYNKNKHWDCYLHAFQPNYNRFNVFNGFSPIEPSYGY